MKRCAHGTEAGCYCDGCAREKPRPILTRCGHGQVIGEWCEACRRMKLLEVGAELEDRRPAPSFEEQRIRDESRGERRTSNWPEWLRMRR